MCSKLQVTVGSSLQAIHNSSLPDWSWESHEEGHQSRPMTQPLQAFSVSWQTSHSHPEMGPTVLTAKRNQHCVYAYKLAKCYNK